MNENLPLSYLLGMTVRAHHLEMISLLKKNNSELSPELNVILFLLSLEKLTQQDLANFLMKDKSFILRQIDTLIKKGYVVRETNKQDKRKKLIELTEKGYNTLCTFKNIGNVIEKRIYSGIEKKSLTQFRDTLDKIKKNLDFDHNNPIEKAIKEHSEKINVCKKNTV
ncbi:MAG: MarR family transcriptional regulator [Prolixibacteraceae bacterium]|nr:MarR family transcriptional regulator [Prolixibacteraceae bacterium]